ATDRRRGRDLSLVVWATTIGAVAGPNLAPVAGRAVQSHGVPTLAGPFVFSACVFVLAAVLLLVFLRPDPLILARSAEGTSGRAAVTQTARPGMWAGLAAVR